MNRSVPIAQVRLTKDEIEAAVAVLRSGRLVQGKKTEELERAFAEKVGATHAVAVSSGTAALHIAYTAAVKAPADVLVPSFSHVSTASMVHMAGLRPVFCDIDPRTFTLDLEDARKRLTSAVGAVAPVHLFGNACDIDGVTAFAREHDLRIVWDAAQAHGTRYKQSDVGSFGDLACYSFYATKNMTTGEGGMITTNEQELAERCRLLRSHCQTEKYYHPQLGFNYRMTDVEAAIGLEQLKKLDRLVQSRRANAAHLTEHLCSVEGLETPYVSDDVDHSYHQYSVLLRLESLTCSRDEIVHFLREKGIGAALHSPRALHEQPAFQPLMTGGAELPCVQDVSQRILSLPVHPGLEQADLDRVIEGVEEAIRAASR